MGLYVLAFCFLFLAISTTVTNAHNDDYDTTASQRLEKRTCTYAWRSWTDWTNCDHPCGDGQRTRQQKCFCDNRVVDNSYCAAAGTMLTESQYCKIKNCCSWTEWSAWGTCDTICDGGIQNRTKTCTCMKDASGNPIESCEDEGFVVPPLEERSCNLQPCCSFQGFTEWTTCSKSCDVGSRSRVELCVCNPDSASLPERRNCTSYRQAVTETASCNTQDCCNWDGWEDWSTCTVACDGGLSTRKAKCSCQWANATVEDCTSRIKSQVRPVQTTTCNDVACCDWTPFGAWSSCSRTCDGGTKTRVEGCSCSFNSTAPVSECQRRHGRQALVETESCNTQDCCKWDVFDEWSKCSKTCDLGVQTRDATCSCLWPNATVQDCLTRLVTPRPRETQPCNNISCCHWDGFEAWGNCSHACDGGLQTRQPHCTCLWPNATIADCVKYTRIPALPETRSCNSDPCCVFTAFAQWTGCSKECGGGVRTRSLLCQCQGKTTVSCSSIWGTYQEQMTEACNVQPCCEWGPFDEWTNCTKDCGGGYQTRRETCICQNATAPVSECTKILGRQPLRENRTCNEQPCCTFVFQNTGHSCSATCGGGFIVQNSSCFCQASGAAPVSCAIAFGPTVLTPSAVIPCAIDQCCEWLPYGEWSSCSKTCGGGTRKRVAGCMCNGRNTTTSTCENYFKLSAPTEIEACNTEDCCAWDGWLNWSSCSKQCGGGTQTRIQGCKCQGTPGLCPTKECQRNVKLPMLTETQTCNNQACCSWGNWHDWCSCSKSCGGGTQTRSKKCVCPWSSNAETSQCTSTLGGIVPTESQSCNQVDCCRWGEWEGWSRCSVYCGNGQMTRAKKCICNNRDCDIKQCLDTLGAQPKEVGVCTKPACCYWVGGPWSSCSKPCGSGLQTKKQHCYCPDRREGTYTDSECYGSPASFTRTCNTQECCSWVWSSWSECSAKCGGGLRTKQQLCNCPLTMNSYKRDLEYSGYRIAANSYCSGTPKTTQEQCNTYPCY